MDELVFLPEQLKAFITYKSETVAQNVLSKKEIVFCDYTFKIKACWETIVQAVANEKSPIVNEMRLENENLNMHYF